MNGAYALEDGNKLSHYHIGEGSIVHPLCKPLNPRTLNTKG